MDEVKIDAGAGGELKVVPGSQRWILPTISVDDVAGRPYRFLNLDPDRPVKVVAGDKTYEIPVGEKAHFVAARKPVPLAERLVAFFTGRAIEPEWHWVKK